MSNAPSTAYTRKTLPVRITTIAWILVALGIVLTSAGYLLDVKRSAFNNVVGFLFLASLAGGSVFLVALEYIAGAVWSVPMRRVSEFLSGLLPIVPLLAIPLLLQMNIVFPWMQPEAAGAEPARGSNAAYLNLNFFIIRFVAIFVILNLFYFLFTRNSTRQDASGDPRLTTRNVRLAAVFMPVFAISISLLAVDWAMSLTPHWYSTIYGVYYFAGTVLAGLASATYIIVKLHDAGYFPNLHRDHFYSLGALLFAFINFWAYIAFSQFLLIWYANLPEETSWFMSRWKDGWQYVSILL
ncbi:MAG TPA: quinol:cytochrome C oxidoreductase, partial [Bacteroidota bacterium]|nr:quinol:cytochrome C oxidoreductase [Bacteroidota bacterium]